MIEVVKSAITPERPKNYPNKYTVYPVSRISADSLMGSLLSDSTLRKSRLRAKPAARPKNKLQMNL
jgi:hypothetical protein